MFIPGQLKNHCVDLQNSMATIGPHWALPMASRQLRGTQSWLTYTMSDLAEPSISRGWDPIPQVDGKKSPRISPIMDDVHAFG